MRYLSWAALYEGSSDALYLDVLLPRVIRDMISAEGKALADVPDIAAVRLGRGSREIKAVAVEICESREAFDLVFIHADTGGRSMERHLAAHSEAYCDAARRLCEWPPERCVTVTPRHEIEAWQLADGQAITSALGYNGAPASIGLPNDASAAEKLVDPKAILAEAIVKVAGRRRAQRIDLLLPAIAQRQQLGLLRQSKSFRAFEDRLRQCMRALAFIV